MGADVAYLRRNKWDGRRIIQWWAENIYRGPVDSNQQDTLASARNEYHKWHAIRERLKAEKERAALIEREEVDRQWTKRVVELTQMLENLKYRLPPALVGKDQFGMTDIIASEVKAIRRAYSDSAKEPENAI